MLIAPLLAVERGHNIVVPGGKAAIGTVYFLARPHHVLTTSPWPPRRSTTGRSAKSAAQAAASTQPLRPPAARTTPDCASGPRPPAKWHRFLTRRLSWTSLPPDEKTAFTWDQLVVIWQVIGRLVRGGVAARVYFVDGAFAPREAGFTGDDTPATSLLASMLHELAPYFDPESAQSAIDRSLVQALYDPLYRALRDMN